MFARSIGETTDVVSKEMYTFEDRGGDSLTLRPEFTAGHLPRLSDRRLAAIRAAEARDARARCSATSARKRGATASSTSSTPRSSARPSRRRMSNCSSFADQLLHELGIADGVTLQLNTLGDAETRDAWRAALVAHFEAHRGDLSRGQPGPARQEPAAHPRQQGPARPADRRCGARHRRVSDERGAARSSRR